jgi:hypothetical protein
MSEHNRECRFGTAHTLIGALVETVANNIVCRAAAFLRDSAAFRAIFEAHQLPTLLTATHIQHVPVIQIVAGKVRVRGPALAFNRSFHVRNTLNVTAFALHFGINDYLKTTESEKQ